jgi:threonine dehydrogenase-like Zn-dependent dehydrogenase
VSDETAIFVTDILSTAYRGVERADMACGDDVAVVGCGPLGLMAIMVARLSAGRILALDTVPARLAAAESLGATPVVGGDNAVETVRDMTATRGADVVLECAGGAPALTTAMQLARPRGTVSVIGAHFEPDFCLDAGAMFANETTLRISIGSPTDDREDVLRLVEAGRLDPVPVISHRMRLEDAPEAYRIFEAREAMKIVITP